MSIDSNEWSGFVESERRREREKVEEERRRKREVEALEEIRNWDKRSKAPILMGLFLKLVPPIVSPRRLTRNGMIMLRRRPVGSNSLFKDIALSITCSGTDLVWLSILDISEEEFPIVQISESAWGSNGRNHKIECKINSSVKDSFPETAVWAIHDFIPMLRREAESKGVDVHIKFDSLI